MKNKKTEKESNIILTNHLNHALKMILESLYKNKFLTEEDYVEAIRCYSFFVLRDNNIILSKLPSNYE